MNGSKVVFSKCLGGMFFLFLLLFHLPAYAMIRTVTSTADSGAGTLRQTIADAAAGDTIDFNLAYPATITLSSELAISKNLTIAGPGAGKLTISGNNAVRIFSISSGTVTISDITAAYGTLTAQNPLTGSGSAFYVGATAILTIDRSHIHSNATNTSVDTVNNTASLGGAIYLVENGALTISNSTISDNAGYTAAAIASRSGCTVTITNCTISGNHSYSNGSSASVSSYGNLTVTNTTITGNTGEYWESGLAAYGGSVTIQNSIVAGNNSVRADGVNLGSTGESDVFFDTSGLYGGGVVIFTSNGSNLIGSEGSQNYSWLASDIFGEETAKQSAGLNAALTDNGGYIPATHALNAGSQAINPASGIGAPWVDQRGYLRNGNADRGAYEYNGTLPAATAATGIGATGFSANWNAVLLASGYRLDVATDSGFTSLVPGYNDLAVGNVTTKAVTGLSPGTTYFYRIRAYMGAYFTYFSNAISVATLVPAPVLTTPTAGNIGSNIATLTFKSDSTGRGYFTLLSGSGTACGTGTQVKNGRNSTGGAALRYGSLPLAANTSGNYTVGNLTQSTNYTVCFTADDGVNLQATPATANLTTTTPIDHTINTWTTVGNPDFSPDYTDHFTMALAPDGTPYAAFTDGSFYGGSKATVMKFNGSAWVTVGSAAFTPGIANYISLAFAPDGTPYMSFKDWGNAQKTTVMKYNGSAWVTVGSAGFSAGAAAYTSLAFAPDGTPYVAYEDDANGGKATVKKFDGTNWVDVGSAGFSFGMAMYDSLAFGPDGTPYVAYVDYDKGVKATVKKFDGANWIDLGTPYFSAGIAYFTSLAFAPDGTLHVAYQDYPNAQKATVKKFDGANWVNVGSAGFSAGKADNVCLAFGPDGSPNVAYGDSGNPGKATVMKYDGATWVNVGPAGFTTGGVGFTTLKFAPNGIPYLGFMDNGAGDMATVMKLVPGYSVTNNSGSLAVVANSGTLLNFLGIIPAGDGSSSANFTVGTSNVAIKNLWTISPYTYVYGGNSIVITADTAPLLSRTGYTLTGWNTAANGSGTPYPVSGTSTFVEGSNTTLYAQWTINSYTVTYNGNGATSGTVPVDAVSHNYNSTVTVLGNTGGLARTGYILAGWNTAADGSGTSYAADGSATFTMPAGNVTLYAKWEVTFTTLPSASNVGANIATLNLQSSATGRGYFTLLTGSGAPCGTGTQVKNGKNSTGAAAFRFGSLPLTAATPGSYTVRDLTHSSNYTICFTADDGVNLQANPATVNLATTSAIDLAMGAWTTVGSAGFTPSEADYISLAFGPDGNPYVAYSEDGNGTWKATVEKYDGMNWATVGSAGFSAGEADFVSLAFAPDGTPFVAYSDAANSSYATVMKYEGAAWVTVGSAGFSAGGAYYTSLSFAPDGTPYVAYMDVLNSSKATVKKFNGTAWVDVGSAGFSAAEADFVSLAFAPDGMPYVAYKDVGNSSKVTVMKYDGTGPTGWVEVGSAGFSAGATNSVSLAFAPDGNPYVAYSDYNTVTGKITVMRYNGTGWVTVGNAGFSAGRVQFTSLAFGPDGKPYVAYSDDSDGPWKATVKRYDGSAWVDAGSAGFSAGGAYYTSLSFAPDGTPHVAYMDFGNSNKATVMKLAPTYTLTYNGSSFSVLANTGTVLSILGSNPEADGSVTLVFGAGASTTATIKALWTINPNTYVYGGNSVTITSNSGDLLTRTGYTLAGWNTAANGSGTSYPASITATFLEGTEVTLYAQWTINSYTVTYNGNGSNGGSVPVDGSSHNYNSSVTVLGNTGNLTKTGYTFTGWNTAADGSGTSYAATGAATFTMGAANVTLYAQWTINSYTVTYNGTDATSGTVPVDAGSHNYNSTVTVLANTGGLARTGYTFTGWNTAADGSGTSYAASGAATFTMGAGDVTLYAQWTMNSYTVTYNGNGSTGGTVPVDGSHNYNSTITVLANTGSLVRTGYTFAGWNTAADGSGTSYAASGSATFTMGTGNVILYAQWTINSYTVTYNGNSNTGGTVPVDAGSHNYNSTVTVLANTGGLTRTGYTFAGWNTAADGSGTSYAASGAATFSMGAGNVTLYAQWTINSYTVTYNGNGSTGGTVPVDAVSHNYNSSVTVLANTGSLTRTGYTFTGWNTAADGSGTSYSAGDKFTMGAANVILYAQWAINSYSVTYNGNGNTGGTIPVDAVSHNYNSTVTVLANTGSLVKSGYTFTGWNTAADGSGAAYAASGAATFTMGAGNVTLYAQWTINSYTVTYDGNGNTGGTVPVDGSGHNYNTSVSVLSNTGGLTKTGYTFAGWNTQANGSGTSYGAGATLTIGGGNVILYARWSSNNYVCTMGHTTAPNSTGNFQTLGNSFTASCTGGITSIDLKIAAGSSVSGGTLNIYSGESVAPADLLYTQSGINLGSGVQRITLTTPLAVTSGNLYTFTITSASLLALNYDGAGGYADGKLYVPGGGFLAGDDLYFSIIISDVTAPTITSATLADSNAYIDIVFSEGIYGAGDGATPLAAANLALTFTRNGGSATNAVISSVKQTDNIVEGSATALSGGETTVRAFLSITGTPSGVETIEIKPVSGTSVYDFAGNAMPAGQTTGVKTLNDQAPPLLTTPITANIGANQATLTLRSDSTGAGYFTILTGSGTACGTGTQVKSGQNSNGAAAFRFGSLALTANTPGSYTMRNLTQSTNYTVCFTADDGTNLQATPATANLTTTAAISLTPSAWTAVGSAGFSAGNVAYTSLAFAPDGTPYVAYMDYGNGQKATVMKHDGTSWVTVGTPGFSAPSGAYYTSLAFAPDGTPYVAYGDGGNSLKSTVMKYDGTAWVNVGLAGFSPNTAYYTSLAFAPDGTPYVAYMDVGNSYKATVMKYDGTAWVAVGSAGFSAARANYTSLAFAPDGTPYVAYEDFGNSYKATVMKYDGAAWVNVGSAGFSADKAYYTSLGFAPDGTPYVAYEDFANGSKATVMKYNGTAWVTVGNAGFSLGQATNTSLGFAPDGTFYVAYTDNGNSDKATVMKYDGTAWVTAGSAGFSAGPAISTSLAFAPDGTPYVAYQDYGSFKATVMKLAPTYTVTYNSNGATSGSVPSDSGTYLQGTTVTVSANTGGLTKTGHTFAGWNTAADGSGTSYDASGSATFTIGSENVSLYAQWTINKFTVTFNSNGGSSVTSQAVTYGSTATQPPTPVKAGYTFGGWYSDVGLTSAYNFTTAITGNITLYATWSPVDQAIAPPLMQISTISNGGVVGHGVQNLCGIVTDANGIESVTVNGSIVPVDDFGYFTAPVELLPGSNSITTVVTNRAGLTKTDTRTMAFDSSVPLITLDNLPDNSISSEASVSVTGAVYESASAPYQMPAATITISVNGSAPQTVATYGGTFSFNASLVEGMNTIRITAKAVDGKTAEIVRTVKMSPLAAFSLAVTDPETDAKVPLSTYTLVGTVKDNTAPVSVSISVDGKLFNPLVAPDGTFQQQITFTEDKIYRVAVTATDQNGKTQTVQRNIVHSLPKADAGSSVPFTIADALRALQIGVGIRIPDNDQIRTLDVAPMVNGQSRGDGKIDILDAVVILRMVVGLI